jgi:molecular chaperone DnaK
MRTHIDYGIYFNSDFCQIARMENGIPVIILSDLQKDSMPLCVAINPRKNIIVGDAAYASNIKDKLRLLKTFGKDDSNSYLSFIRTLGTDLKYHSSLLCKDFSSEELLAECFKKLKSFISDEKVHSVVITVPAMFTMAKNEATIIAAKLAGFEVVELLQEPIAASIAYGLDTKEKDGKWLVFDFGGGTFDAALLKVDEGIMKVLDTEGNNELGGKDLDLAIVDNIIIPYLKENYSIDGILANKAKREILRNAMKSFAEKAKLYLSFNATTDILCFPDEIGILDEDGNELALSIEITKQDLAWVSRSIYQKAIDISIELLKRNNIRGKEIESICLVGEETFSPILRRMLKEQITDKVDTSVDPITAVAKGVALFASTISVSDEIKKTNINNIKIQLDVKYATATVELDELVCLKVSTPPTPYFIAEPPGVPLLQKTGYDKQ